MLLLGFELRLDELLQQPVSVVFRLGLAMGGIIRLMHLLIEEERALLVERGLRWRHGQQATLCSLVPAGTVDLDVAHCRLGCRLLHIDCLG